MNAFLEKEKATIQNQDPTNKFQMDVKNSLKNKNALFTEAEKQKLVYMNPTPPKLYGLIKLHKDNNPIRPVVSYINCPVRKIAIKLNTIFKKVTNFKSKYSVKNSLELTKKLANVKLKNNTKLVSFDVSNMFSNIPPEECLTLITDILDKKNVNITIKNELIELFEIVLNQNYFEFNNKFYKQHSGLPMGSPTSPLLAEIFMSHIEETIFNSKQVQQQVTFWYRYVDDVLVGFNGTERQLDSLLNSLNSIHPRINFTLEIEKNKTINFLDLTISHNNKEINCEVYRKPTFSGVTIHKTSQHPWHQKISPFNAMLHRAVCLPLSAENFKKEILVIKQIAVNNGFNEEIIEQLLKTKSRKYCENLIYPRIQEQPGFYNTLSFFGPISNKIYNVIKKCNKNVTFKPYIKMSNLLYNAKSKTNKLQKSGVYKLSCNDCNGVYIGQTGRNFSIRFKEHLNAFKKGKKTSTFANHALDNNHCFDESSLSVIHLAEKGLRLTILESLEIHKQKNNPDNTILNDQLDLMYTPLFRNFI